MFVFGIAAVCLQFHIEVFVYILLLFFRIGADPLLQVLNKQMSLATAAAQTKNNPQAWSNMIINTLSFHNSISVVTGKEYIFL